MCTHNQCLRAKKENKNTNVRSFKSSQNIQKNLKECGSDCTVSNNKFSSVTLNELAMKARESIQSSSFNKAVNLKTDINPNRVQIAKICLDDTY